MLTVVPPPRISTDAPVSAWTTLTASSGTLWSQGTAGGCASMAAVGIGIAVQADTSAQSPASARYPVVLVVGPQKAL